MPAGKPAVQHSCNRMNGNGKRNGEIDEKIDPLRRFHLFAFRLMEFFCDSVTLKHTSTFSLPNAQEGQAEVINLPADTLVITKNRFRVKDGQKIKIQ